MIATPTIPLPSFKEEEEYDAADGYQYSIERENELQWIKKSSSFFAFIRKHFHSSSACSDVILASPVAKLMHWMHSSNVIRDMNLRGKGTREVDAAIDDYLRANDFFVALLRGCRLICEETESQGQIGFSYPGFEAQHFDVGRFSIVDCVRFFRGLYETYSEEDWQGALRSKCIGKELMQTTPDVSGLYEMGHMEEAKNLSFQIAKGLFHNLSLASFFRCHPHSFIDETRVNWSNVRQWFGSDCVNYKHLKQWDNLSYVFNPSRQHLFAMLLAFENSKADPTKLTTRVACDYLGFFVFFRCLLAYRQEKLQYLSFAIRFWLSSGERKKSVKQANRESTLINLQSLIDKEERQLAELLHIIPKYQQLDNLMPQLRKRNASRVLDNFLPSRPTKEELKEKNLIFDGDSLKRAASPTSNLKHRFTPPPPLAPNHPLTSIHSPS